MDIMVYSKKNKREQQAEILLRRIRWIIISICCGFVIEGWIESGKKYFSGKTSISTTVTESVTHQYPSITICPGMRNNANIREAIIRDYHGRDGMMELTEDDLQQVVDPLTFERTDFLSFFSHPQEGNPKKEESNILNNETYWKESIPDQSLSGKCFTYDPTYQSFAGKWYAIMFDLRVPEHLKSDKEKNDFMEKLSIFLHPKDEFIFYKEDDMPGSFKIDNSLLKPNMENSFNLKVSSLTSLNKADMPCETSPNYSFLKCFELFWSKKRGCQKPWFYFDEFNIPICKNISGEIEKLLGNEYEWSQAFWSRLVKVTKTGCPVPCTDLAYDVKLSYGRVNSTELSVQDGDYRIYIWFKNFKFTHREEFVVCDWTCLIGEIGGNFGFFLGGSILAIYDILHAYINKRI